MEYKVKKRDIHKKDIKYLEIYFKNGDFLTIKNNEIIDISLTLADELVVGTMYWNEFCPVIYSGYLKIKPLKKRQGSLDERFLFDDKKYQKDRVQYIFDRLIQREDSVVSIQLFNEYNHCTALYGISNSIVKDDNIMITFSLIGTQSNQEKYHTIALPELQQSIIGRLELDFENCDGIYISHKEIVEMNISLKPELEWYGNYYRVVQKGYLKIKLDKNENSDRETRLWKALRHGKKGNKQIERRIYGKKGYGLHDICNLYIEYRPAGVEFYRKECIVVNDIRTSQELKTIQHWEANKQEEYQPCFVGGYAKKDGDMILIVFGKENLNDEDYQKLLKKF